MNDTDFPTSPRDRPSRGGSRFRFPARWRPLARVYPRLAERLGPATVAQSHDWQYLLVSVPLFYAAYILFIFTWLFADVDHPIWSVLIPLAGACVITTAAGVQVWLTWLASFFIDAPDRVVISKPSGKVVEYFHSDIVRAKLRSRWVIDLTLDTGKHISVNLATFDAPHLLRHLVLLSAQTEPPHEALNLLSDLVDAHHLPHPPIPLDQTIYQLATTGRWPSQPHPPVF